MSGKRIPIHKHLATPDHPRSQRQRRRIEYDQIDTLCPQMVHELSDDFQLRLSQIAIFAEIDGYVCIAEGACLTARP